ncbi:response regulator [Nitrososphaera sp.]|uniref:response regulator n=1 Tax=Nitrososphaera sp. TaxID=1971748 RepID=UPI003D6FF972
MPRIMVVEDEEDLLTVVYRYLVKWGFDAEPFGDSIKALQRFKESPSAFSLVLSDVRMPGMDGIHFTKEVLKIRPDTKIVMMTAFVQDEYVCSNLPMIKKEDTLKKPFRLAEVCTAVKKATGVTT